MRKLNKALRLLLCASLVCSMGLSATACNVDEDPNDPDTPPVVKPDDPNNPGGVFVPPSQDASEGIDWTKYWDGVSSVAGSEADNFKFDKTKDIGNISGEYTPDTSEVAEGEQCIVKFSDGVSAQSVISGGTAVKPIAPENDGKMLVNWHESGSTEAYDFSSPVTTNLNLVAEWADLDAKIISANGYNESLAVVWEDSDPSSASVKYRKTGGNWTNVDSPLIREVDGNARVDIVGLPAGTYEVEITTSSGSSLSLPKPITVEAYDRSGYAHFNYTQGIGAYNDDGSLKDGAIVIYVTEENKDTVMSTVPELQSAMFDIPTEKSDEYAGRKATGIGWWLNNTQYTRTTTDSKGNITGYSNTWSSNGKNLGFINVNDTHPIVIRFIGTVTTPEGCTRYDSLNEGGSVGDNGHMARMKDLKNITLEGIGDDAVIKGWGFHFMANDTTNGKGSSFEVRNLTFDEYPEDAIGMEGVQKNGQITSSVERCWIHNNVFLPGRCDNPAESDKKEGDGSCDFKRGQYYTLSYNYFTDCHKTNLIGSSDDSLQFNVTLHHNWWNNCGSRQPLARQANIHMYNNYFSTPTTNASYITSLRGGTYIFSEANYYESTKNVTQLKAGALKAYNNIYYQVNGQVNTTEVTNREQAVANSCHYGDTDYSSFDTNSKLFYYDSVNKRSDCLLDSAHIARVRTVQYAGVQDFGNGKTTVFNRYTPDNALQIGSNGLTVDLKSVAKGSSTVSGVLFNGITGVSSGTVKGKNQIITFTLSSPAQITVTTATSGDPAPELIRADGYSVASKFTGTLSAVLDSGTYIIASGQWDKEATISELSFTEAGNASEYRIEAAKAALSAIPSTITINSESVIEDARKAYGALLSDEKKDEDIEALYPRYAKAAEALSELQIEYVTVRIAYIGEVTANSYNKISAAQTAYSKLSASQQSAITNYNVLTAALATYEGFAAQNVINKLLDLPDLTSPTVKVNKREALDKLQDWFDAVNMAFGNLTSGDDEEATNQQATVKQHANGATYKKLTDGLAQIAQIDKLFTFTEALEAADEKEASTVGATLLSLYNGLTADQQATITGEALTKFNTIKAAYQEFASKSVKAIFNGTEFANENGGKTFTLEGGNVKKYKDKDTGKILKLNGVTYYDAVELKDGGSIKFTLEEGVKKTLKIYMNQEKSVKIDDVKTGKSKALTGDGNTNCYVLEIEVTGTGKEIVITKDGTPIIFMLELI